MKARKIISSNQITQDPLTIADKILREILGAKPTQADIPVLLESIAYALLGIGETFQELNKGQ